MFAKQFAAGFAAAALLSTAAFAQAPASPSKDSAPMAQPAPKADEKPAQQQSANEWRGSKVIGLYVYNDANERLGSINELLMDSSGKVSKAVIGVGGFLGIGESDVAVNFEQLKFSNEPMKTTTSSTSTPSTGAGGSSSGTVGTTSTTSSPPAAASKPSINPDHAKLSMTKEQLKALPQFKYAN